MNRDDAMVFLGAILIAVAVVTASAAFAVQEPRFLPIYDCSTVRAFVAEHGKVKALALALENGATWRQIREAQKCLK